MEARINELLPLATRIAREFSNIPGLPHAEIDLAAQEALAHAARLFDPAKGDFTAYAARAMRNTLRDLHERQIRHHRHHVYDLDLPVTQSATTPEARIQQVPSPNVLTDQAAAHQEGFVHRDIKPHNILLHRSRAKISDFGLAKNFQKAGLSGMSMTGNHAGTPVFMPPEQITNFKYVKPVSDVWSFAASLYQLLTGKFPYRFDPKRDPIDIILNENPVPIRDRMPALEKNLSAVIDKALVRNPKDRFPDAGKLLASLPK